jgi:hypothetical protein
VYCTLFHTNYESVHCTRIMLMCTRSSAAYLSMCLNLKSCGHRWKSLYELGDRLLIGLICCSLDERFSAASGPAASPSVARALATATALLRRSSCSFLALFAVALIATRRDALRVQLAVNNDCANASIKTSCSRQLKLAHAAISCQQEGN